MINDTLTANSESGIQDSEQTVSPMDLIKRGLGSESQIAEETAEAEDPVAGEATEVQEDTGESQESEPDQGEESSEPEGGGDNVIDVLSQFDYDSLTDDTAKELGKWFSEHLGEKASSFFEGSNSGAGKDIAKWRNKYRDSEAEIESLKKQLGKATENLSPSTNIYSKVTDEKELDKIEEANEQSIKEAMRFLSSGDEYYELDGKDFDRETIGKWLQTYLEQQKAIPLQRQNLKELSGVGGIQQKEIDKAKKELSWFNDDESELYGEYKSKVDDLNIDLIAQVFPKEAAKLKRITAHAVNSMKTKEAPNISLKRRAPAALGTKSSGATTQRKTNNTKLKMRNQAMSNINSGKATKNDVRNLIASAI